MKYIYIELGVVDLAKVTTFYDSHRDHEWHFELFEPNPWNNERITALIEQSSIPNIKLHPVAATAQEGKRTFYYSRGYGLGSSFFLGKRFIDAHRHIEVDCIDFNKWMIDNLNKDDYIYMSMDIEGSEYEVFPHMIKGGSIFYIDSLEVEFHVRKFRGENGEKFRKIHDELKSFFGTFNAEKTLRRL